MYLLCMQNDHNEYYILLMCYRYPTGVSVHNI